MTKGYKTSEFWVKVVTTVLTLVNASGALGEYTIPIEGILPVIALAVGYIVSRGMAKTEVRSE